MCEIFDIGIEMNAYEEKLNKLLKLSKNAVELTPRDKTFANSLIEFFLANHTLSFKQWASVDKLAARFEKAEPIYGDFDAVHVMFQLAGEKLKFPKVRLLSKEEVFVQLTFRKDTRLIELHRDGWKGHGKRKFIGWIKDNVIVPYAAGSITEDISDLLQEFAYNPQQVAQAMAAKLEACAYCGKALSDPTSKKYGYGATCANNWGLEYKR